MKQVMVTGAAGFVGSALCAELVQAGYCVIGVVRKLSCQVPQVSYIEADLSAATPFANGFPTVDCIIHLAGRAHILHDDTEDPLSAFREINRDATCRLALRALEAGVRRFVFVSSIGVNGSRTEHEPYTEDSKPQPQTDYAVSKFEAETQLQALLLGTGMELVIVRPPLIYAEDAPGNFARLLKLIGSGLPLPLRNVNNRRSFLSRKNIVGFLKLSIEHPRAASEVFLLADGQDISTASMIKAICEGMGRRSSLFPCPIAWMKLALNVLGKPLICRQLFESLQVDASKARNLLGWVPDDTTCAGLKEAGRKYMSGRKGGG